MIGLGLLVAGCAGPGGDDGDDDGPEFTSQNESAVGEDNTSATPDNDAGAEPIAPPDDQNRTNATAPDEADGATGDAGAAEGAGDTATGAANGSTTSL